jgi:hypothetical protein
MLSLHAFWGQGWVRVLLQLGVDKDAKTVNGATPLHYAAAAKHGGRSESLAALVAVARTLIAQARAAEAERVRVAAEAAEAAAAVEAAEWLRLEEVAAALTLRMQGDALRMQSDALMLQQVQAQLGISVVPPVAPAPHPDAEETMCVVCLDAPKLYAMVPCMHMCACEACGQLLGNRCPVCRGPIESTVRCSPEPCG